MVEDKTGRNAIESKWHRIESDFKDRGCDANAGIAQPIELPVMQRLPASLRSRHGHQSRSASTLAERRVANNRIRLSQSVSHDKGGPRYRSQCLLDMML